MRICVANTGSGSLYTIQHPRTQRHEVTQLSQEKSEAHVLRGIDFSETSRIITFLTPTRGQLTCIAKGARRKNSPLASALNTLNRVELVYYWKEGRSVQTLGEASLLESFPRIRCDLERGAYAAFPLEIALKVAHENEPCQSFYNAFSRGLYSLNAWDADARAHCCWQVARLLASAGYHPELFECVQCGGEIGDNSGFDYNAGTVCGKCTPDRRIDPATLDDLRAVFGAELACPGLASAEITFRVLRTYAARQTETDYRSLRVLDDMFV
jgi:DNA repair protein RecO (recombination protein O)